MSQPHMYAFPIVKLLDYQGQQETLATNANPFATVVLAHLAAQATRQDPLARGRAKLSLTRRLYGLGYEREAIINLVSFHRLAAEPARGVGGQLLGRTPAVRGGTPDELHQQC